MSSLNSLVSSAFKDKENSNPNRITKATSGFNYLKDDHSVSVHSRPSLINSVNRR